MLCLGQVSLWDYLEYEIIRGVNTLFSRKHLLEGLCILLDCTLICIVCLSVFIGSVKVKGWSLPVANELVPLVDCYVGYMECM